MKADFETKLEQLEKKVSEEREKSLLAQMRSREDDVTAAKVEVSLKELQDRLRRDRADQEAADVKLKLERKAQELEARLAQERETWVTTLKSQLAARESQDKEVETHFAMRLQEMERRWLEEKAQWQKAALAKDDEVRTLRALAEKLRGADAELTKAVAERKILDERLTEVLQERAEAVARLQSASDREKESIQLRADLTLTRQQAALVQERLERDLAALRHSSREREERLMSDQERLQRDLASIKQRLEGEHEANLRRAQAEHGAELVKHRDAAEKATSELTRLRAVASALERQGAAARAQLDEMRRQAVSWEKTQERYKAEFVVLQRKWVEREKEVRAEATQSSLQMVEAEKTRLRVQAQDELNQRAAKIADQLRQEAEHDAKRLESKLRAELEQELAERRHAMQAEADARALQAEQELQRLRRELQQKDASWGERLLAKESEVIAQRSRADDLAGKLSREEDARTNALRDRLELEKQLEGLREQSGAQQASIRAFQDRVAAAEADKAKLEAEKTELERLSTAQAAQVSGTQEALESARLQLARETQSGKILQNAREQAEKALAASRAELSRALAAQKAEHETALRAERARADDAAAHAERRIAESAAAARAEAEAAMQAAREEAAAARAEAQELIAAERARLGADAMRAQESAADAERRAAELQAGLDAARGEAADLGAKLEECRKQSWADKLFKRIREAAVITLHKLNGTAVVVNAELIETMETGHETLLLLATGNKIAVRETADEVVAKVVEYRKAVNTSGKPVNPIGCYERQKS
ncbi:MAG: flagellar FlbD family protein [Elusimicrobiota bacterium]|nr:MAG: flagellar FlbD family protein [Elusimicrobiota bacterium]